jgi:hypothetical protein
MKKKLFVCSLLIIAFAICLTIESCKKHDKALNPIIGKWTLTAYIHDGIDVYGTGIPACLIDDIFTFTSDLTLIVDEGPTKCSPTDPQTTSGTYSLNSDNTQLTTSIAGNSEVFNIMTLNSTTLKTNQVDNGDIATYTKIP